jgi:hypothetical protein
MVAILAFSATAVEPWGDEDLALHMRGFNFSVVHLVYITQNSQTSCIVSSSILPEMHTPGADEMTPTVEVPAQTLPTPPATSRPPLPWHLLAAEVEELYRLDRKSCTCLRVRQVLRELAAVGVADVLDLTPVALARWKASAAMAARAPLTRKALFSAARSIAAYAVGRGYLTVSPFAAWPFRFPARRKTCDRHHSAEELARVLGLLDAERKQAAEGTPDRWFAERLYALFCTAAFTGARKMEILRLRLEDLDLDRGMLSIVDREHYRHADLPNLREAVRGIGFRPAPRPVSLPMTRPLPMLQSEAFSTAVFQ